MTKEIFSGQSRTLPPDRGEIKEERALPEERGGKTPAAALTAYARAADRLRTLRAGYQHHVTKPAEPQELVAVVASLAGRSRGE